MSVDQLRNVIRESSSQRIKEMAKGILAEKAAQRMYGGGIVAFQRGGRANYDWRGPEEFSEVSVPQSPFVAMPIPSSRSTDPAEVAQAQAMQERERADQEEDRQKRKAIYDRFMAREAAKSPEQRAAEQQDALVARDEQAAINRANFVESVRQQYGDEAANEAAATGSYVPGMAPRAPTQTRSLAPPAAGIMEAAQPAPVEVPAAAPAAITAAQPAPAAALTGRTSTAEGRAGEAEAQGAGITSVAPPRAAAPVAPSGATPSAERVAGEAEARAGTAPVVTAPTFTGTLADAQRAEYEARTRANRPVSDFLQEIETGKPENTAAAESRRQIMAERANAKDEAERQRHMRLAQFFAKWGSTPGPTIAAGLNALEKTIPDLISDEKEQKKIKRELDKVMYDIDNSIRLEKLGDMKEARALKEKAADRAQQLQERLMQVQQSEEASKRNLEGTKYAANKAAEAARSRASEGALDREEARKSREARDLEMRLQAARTQQETVNSNIAREKTSKAYTDAQRTVEMTESMSGVRNARGEIDVSKIPEERRTIYNNAKKLIEGKDTEFETRRQNAQNVVDAYTRRILGGAEGSGPPPRSREDTDALNWANANPNDPRAAEIKKRLNVK
jgi:hypothetical protein